MSVMEEEYDYYTAYTKGVLGGFDDPVTPSKPVTTKTTLQSVSNCIKDLQRSIKNLEKDLAKQKKQLSETQQLEYWIKILDKSQTDTALHESVNQLLTLYRLKK